MLCGMRVLRASPRGVGIAGCVRNATRMRAAPDGCVAQLGVRVAQPEVCYANGGARVATGVRANAPGRHSATERAYHAIQHTASILCANVERGKVKQSRKAVRTSEVGLRSGVWTSAHCSGLFFFSTCRTCRMCLR